MRRPPQESGGAAGPTPRSTGQDTGVLAGVPLSPVLGGTIRQIDPAARRIALDSASWAQGFDPGAAQSAAVEVSYDAQTVVEYQGKRYGVALQRSSVHDYAFPIALFTAPADWTRVELELSDFKQPDWGQKVPGPYTDAIGLSFTPGPQFDDEDFDFWIDDVELLKAP